MACTTCQSYLGEWRSHGPTFPEGAWEPVQFEWFEVGAHGATSVMQGTARCRTCGLVADFGCSMPDGYYFIEKK
ncbi:MAG TPA: hypothetical protein VMZ53_33015 [Kofleriaceae bacterium]|nr:hypothetical protein [Kofleriaceae bacterium]